MYMTPPFLEILEGLSQIQFLHKSVNIYDMNI